jgi:hypothetical protein
MKAGHGVDAGAKHAQSLLEKSIGACLMRVKFALKLPVTAVSHVTMVKCKVHIPDGS